MFLIILFSSFLPTEGLEFIIETSRRYIIHPLEMMVILKMETIWKTEKTMSCVSGVDIISALKEVTNY